MSDWPRDGQRTGFGSGAGAVTTHEGAADPHTGYLKESDIAAKGDLFAGTADNTVGIVTAGNLDQVLTPDSAQTAGVKWASVPTSIPLAVATPVLWYAADRIPGVAHAAAIATWPDLSGNGVHAVQGTGGKQPLLQAGGLNGLPTVRFDGTDDTIATPAASFGTSATRTIIAVGRRLAAAGRFWGLEHAQSSVFDNGGAWGYYSNEAAAVVALGGDTDDATVVSVVYASTSSASGYVNGGAATAFNPADFYASAQRFALGNSTAAGTDYWNGDIAEVVMYSTALSDANRQRVERYLGAKWGVTVA